MSRAFTALVESAKYAVTILFFTLTKDIPPSANDQLIDALVDVGVALVSGLITLLLFNIVFGLPRVELAWVVGNETPANNRPELAHRDTGVCFRYMVTADTFMARLILLQSKKLPMEGRIRFSPAENLTIRKQRCGRETVIIASAVTTRFKKGLTRGHGVDGEISLRLKEPRSISTKIDCSLSMHTLAADGKMQRIFGLLLTKLFKCDAAIEGFVMKGGLPNGSTDERANLSQATAG